MTNETMIDEQADRAETHARRSMHEFLETHVLKGLSPGGRTMACVYLVEVGAQLLAIEREKDRGRLAKRAALRTAGMALYGNRTWSRRVGLTAFLVGMGVTQALTTLVHVIGWIMP